MTWPVAWTPASVRPAQTATIGWPATNPTAASTIPCTDTACACDCHPAKSLPSYSTSAATRTLTGQRFYEARGFLFLAGGTFLDDLFEDAACPFGIAHVHVRTREIELGAHFAHGHRLQFRYAQIHGLQL